MSSLYATALTAAHDAAASQHYPQGALYVVATPIGNLADITLRALYVLQLADTIACEDTRHTQALLRAYGVDKPAHQLLAVHQHNETQASGAVIARLDQGQRVAFVSDAGTPAISDPGARLVAAVSARNLTVVPLPGPSSVTTALSAAGVIGDDRQGFVFAGFLSSKAGERGAEIARLAAESRCVVLLEAPHRIEAVATALVVLGQRLVTIGRELTKQFEEIATVRCADFPGWLGAQPTRLRGEFALVLHSCVPDTEAAQAHEQRVLRLLLAELPLKTAARLAADITGASKNLLYDAALAIKKQGANLQKDASDISP